MGQRVLLKLPYGIEHDHLICTRATAAQHPQVVPSTAAPPMQVVWGCCVERCSWPVCQCMVLSCIIS